MTSKTSARDSEVWVVACGNASRRDSVERFFRESGICAIGPAKEADDEEVGSREAGRISAFHSIRPGDILLLSGGVNEIRSIGVAGEPTTDFDLAVASWDLGHVAPVTWLDARDQIESAADLLDDLEKARAGHKLPQMRFARLGNKALRRRAVEVVESAGLRPPGEQYAPLATMSPADCANVARKGCPNGISTEPLAEVLEEAGNFGTDNYPRLEADTVAMIVVPLLKALGVSSERIRVEVPLGWVGAQGAEKSDVSNKRVDVVVFGDSTTGTPLALIEAKRRWQGLDLARNQVYEYAEELQMRDSLSLIVTDGAELDFGFSGDDDPRHANLSWRTEKLASALAELAGRLLPPGSAR